MAHEGLHLGFSKSLASIRASVRTSADADWPGTLCRHISWLRPLMQVLVCLGPAADCQVHYSTDWSPADQSTVPLCIDRMVTRASIAVSVADLAVAVCVRAEKPGSSSFDILLHYHFLHNHPKMT